MLMQFWMAGVLLDDEAYLMIAMEYGQKCDFQPKYNSLDVLQLLPVQDLLEFNQLQSHVL